MPDNSLPETIEQTQLRGLVESIIRNTEQDNMRLAFDLHDGLVQLLVASYQHFQASQAWHQRDPSMEQKEFLQGLTILRQAITEARRLINELRPSGLDELGLTQALRLYAAQVEADSNLSICLDIAPDWPQLNDNLETTLFRIIQEAITNARKHSNSARLAVDLRAESGTLQVSIRDWGCGFRPDAVEPDQAGSHIGLIGIRERARLLGGECMIESEPGMGTTIRVVIPHADILPASRQDAGS